MRFFFLLFFFVLQVFETDRWMAEDLVQRENNNYGKSKKKNKEQKKKKKVTFLEKKTKTTLDNINYNNINNKNTDMACHSLNQ